MLSLQDRDDALPTGSADGDEAAAAGSLLVQLLGERGDDAPSGRGEGVTGGEGRAVDVEPAAVDAPSGASRPSRSRQKSWSSHASSVVSTVEANASWIS